MTILLGIDFETTGLNHQTDQVIEVGMALYDTESRHIIQNESYLVYAEEIPDDVTALTGITGKMCNAFGIALESVARRLHHMACDADWLVAHHADFEKSFMPHFYDSLVEPQVRMLSAVPWIDTKTDLPYPPMKGKGTLNDIAMSHGVFNPQPHRALPDVHTMLSVLSQYDFAEVERYAKAETITMVCSFPYNATGERQALVKSLGYYWNSECKWWHKPCKEFKQDEEIQAAYKVGLNAHRLEKEPV